MNREGEIQPCIFLRWITADELFNTIATADFDTVIIGKVVCIGLVQSTSGWSGVFITMCVLAFSVYQSFYISDYF